MAQLQSPISLLVAVSLSACSGNDDDAMESFNKQDVTFASDMIPHHAQAVEMSKLADTRAQAAQVKALADKIEAAQQPEIDRMNGWLTSWGAPTVDVSKTAGEHEGHGASMLGMMSTDDMKSWSHHLAQPLIACICR